MMSMIADSALPFAFMLGLFSTLHCWGMCGGIVAALGFALPEQVKRDRRQLLLFTTAYNLGRITSYAIAGAAAGLIGHAVAISAEGHGLLALQVLAGLVLILLGIQMLSGLPALAWLERAGARVWQKLQPLGRRLLPANSLPRVLLMGGIWGWLPCGMVYTALLLAAASASVTGGMAYMAAFGLGTLPALVAAGFAAGRLMQWLRNRHVRMAAGLVLILYGLLLPLLHMPGLGLHDHDQQVHQHDHDHHHDRHHHHD